MSAEAMRQEDPRWGELVALMGWPWKLALALLVAGAGLAGLPQAGSGAAALACVAAAALLALGSGLYTLRALLRTAAEEPAAGGNGGQDLIGGLRRLLEEQQLQVHEATAAASRAVASAAQLSGLASHVERQFRQTLEHAAAGSGPLALPERLEGAWPEQVLARLDVCARQAEAMGDRLQTLPAIAHQMEESSRHLQRSATAMLEAEGLLQALPAAAVRMAAGAERLEAATRTLDHLPDTSRTLSAAAQALGEGGHAAELQSARLADTGQRLAALACSLGGHVERVLRNEATLGDAARYLTETTDRFAGGLATLETQAVRLQAMISITGDREAEAGPLRDEMRALRQQMAAMAGLAAGPETTRQRLGAQPLPPAVRAGLEQLGAVEADAAQLLQEAAAMPQQALPPAFASRAAKLLQTVQENIRHLHAAAEGASPAAA